MPAMVDSGGSRPSTRSLHTVPLGKIAGRVRQGVEVALAADVAHAADAVTVEQRGVEDLEVEAERVDAERVGPVDPAVGARRMRLHGHQRVEVPPDALDVRRQEGEAAVLGVEGVAVQVDGLGGAFLERGAHDLDDVGDRRHACRARPRAPSRQKRHGEPCTLKPHAPAGWTSRWLPSDARRPVASACPQVVRRP